VGPFESADSPSHLTSESGCAWRGISQNAPQADILTIRDSNLGFLGWEVLGLVHEGRFGAEVWTELKKFGQDHPLPVFCIGLGALFAFAAWPEYIKPWWPSWLTYTPLHDKFHRLQSEFSEHAKASAAIIEAVIKTNDDNISALGKETIEVAKKLGSVDSLLGIARLSVESSGSQIIHFTTPFSA
jgi:hypothetical protein